MKDDAAKAVLQADGLQMGEHKIGVAISNPPKRRPPEETSSDVSSTHTPSLGSGKKDVNRIDNPRTMLSFQPRALKSNKPSGAQKKQTGTSGEQVPAKVTDDAKVTDAKQGLSNDQFRQMMLKKS